MKRFNTKKDLLRYLGKNEDDRKLVTRMVERGEVRVEWRVYIIDEEEVSGVSSNSSDLEYLNKEYEKLEGLLDYSLRKCYNFMKGKGLVGSEDTYEDFYEKITRWYQYGSKLEVKTENVAERGNSEAEDLSSIVNRFGIKRASDLI